MTWKYRKASKFLFPYIKKVLDEKNIPFNYYEEDEYVVVFCPVKNRYWNVIRDDAKCLVEQEQSDDPATPVISYWRYKHGYAKGPFVIFSKDKEKFEKHLKK